MTARELKEKLDGIDPEQLDGLEVVFVANGGEETISIGHFDIVSEQVCLYPQE